jgi:hypothetical protein
MTLSLAAKIQLSNASTFFGNLVLTDPAPATSSSQYVAKSRSDQEYVSPSDFWPNFFAEKIVTIASPMYPKLTRSTLT